MPPGKAMKMEAFSYIIDFLSCIVLVIIIFDNSVCLTSFWHKNSGITPVTLPFFSRQPFATSPIKPIFAAP